MKKFVSMAMVAAMTTSMVPATAFAADSVNATATVVNSWTNRDSDPAKIDGAGVPELQLEVTGASVQGTDPTTVYEFTVALDGADFDMDNSGKLEQPELDALEAGIKLQLDKDGTLGGGTTSSAGATQYTYTAATDAQVKAFMTAVYNKVTKNESIPASVQLYNTAAAAANPAHQHATAIPATTASNFDGTVFKAVLPTQSGATAVANRTTAIVAYTEDVAGLGSGNDDSVYSANYVVDGKMTPGFYYNGGTEFISEADLIKWVADSTVAATPCTTTTVTAAVKATVAGGAWVDNAKWEDFSTWIAKWDTYAKVKGTGNLSAETVTVTGEVVAEGNDRTNITPAIVTPANTTDVNEIEVRITCALGETLQKGDKITMDLLSVLDKASDAYVSVESDDITISNDSEDLLYVAVEDEGVEASIAKLAMVAEEEKTILEKDLKIKSTVGSFVDGQIIELKLSNGFEYGDVVEGTYPVTDKGTPVGQYTLTKTDDDVVKVTIDNNISGKSVDKFEIAKNCLEIEAVSATSGDIATIKVKATNNVDGAFNATASVEVAQVIDYTVVMSVDEDEDVPVIYSGVDADNTGITDDSNHMSLEVTIEETFPGAWSMRDGFNLELPDGVYVTNVNVKDVDGLTKTVSGTRNVINPTSLTDEFEEAYKDGDHKNFEFAKRVFDDVDNTLNPDEAMMSFELELVADPTFVGDVTLKLTGDLVDEQEVTIAKFAPIAIVEAEQNDLKIDYRYTEIPTEVKVTEAEAGLWKEGSKLWVAVDKADYIEFEDSATFEVTGGLEIDDFTDKKLYSKSADEMVPSIGFEVEEESDEAATVTISDMSLFMQRNIPAGAYDLTAGGDAFMAYHKQQLFAADNAHTFAAHVDADCDDECYVDDVCDYSDVVKEAFVNIVTAGREQDDASFTTKVVVPVGESYIVSGEKQVELDVPAYISEAGYTMLPVRAVANALGISNNNVLWNGETKTVTILYGQRIITMVAGQKVINVNGSAIPASAAVEIKDGRTFLPLRDLGTALGVTTIDWDAATKTATLN